MTEILRDSADSRKDSTIQGNNFGGLNTVSNPLNMPYGDSPELLNVDITPGGNVQKRKGTREVMRRTNTTGTGLYSIRMPSGRTFIVSKEGTTLAVYTENMNTVLTRPNVFSGAAQSSNPVFIPLEDIQSDRILILTGTNAPIQVCFRETQHTVAPGATSFAAPAAQVSLFAMPSSLILVSVDPGNLANQTVHTATTLVGSIGSGQQVTLVNFTPAVPAGATRSMVSLHISWQWWAESYTYLGNRFYDMAPRFGVNAADRHVKIPEQLLDGGIDYAGNSTLKALYAYNTISPNTTAFAFNQTKTGTGQNDYWFTNGTPANITANNHDVNTIYSHVSFGTNTLTGLTLSDNYAPIHFIRDRRLFFNGGNGFIMNRVGVTADKMRLGYAWFNAGTIGYASPDPFEPPPIQQSDYAVLASQADGSRMAGTLNLSQKISHFVGFYFGAKGMGVPTNARVRFINCDCAWVGTAANRNAWETHDLRPFMDGVAYPAYGLGEYANYEVGYFPSVGIVSQGRLWLGGVANDPLRIVGSAISDTEVPGEFFNHFQIDAFTPITGAFDVVMPGASEDFILGLGEKNGNLFAISRLGTYRIRPTDSGGFVVSRLGTKGATNRRAVAQVEERLIFAGDRGLYEIRESEGLADSYQIVEMSAKINTRFRPNETNVIGYDYLTRKLYVGNSQEILVYFFDTAAFSVYQYHTRPQLVYCCGTQTRFFVQLQLNRLGSNVVSTLQTEFPLYIDFCGGINNLVEADTRTTQDGIIIYRHLLLCNPLNDVNDLTVVLNGVVLKPGVDYWKRTRNSIYLAQNPGAGKTLSIAVTPATWVTPLNAAFSGYNYLCYWLTPKFYWGSISRQKRVQWFSAVFSNEAKGSYFENVPNPQRDQGIYQYRINASLAFIYSDEQTSDRSADIYGLDTLTWDISLFDVFGSPADELDYRAIKEPTQGIGYAFQTMVYSYDDAVWTICGYQIEAKARGRYRGV